jgi:hypothetical protein
METKTFMYFWFILTWVAILWYSTITVYVAIRGAFDIKHMLARLKDNLTLPSDNPLK